MAVEVTHPGDSVEQEADHLARHAMARNETAADRASEGLASESNGPLSKSLRAFFEPRFGFNFSHVRIHSDERAAASARAFGAHAYTLGKDIVFGAGAFDPYSTTGRESIAHELAHVVQHGEGGPEREQALLCRQSTEKATPAPAPAGKQQGDALVKEFATKFPAAAKLIAGHASAEELVREAALAGAKFGGFAEDGPGKVAWPYTVDVTVYVPKAQTDPHIAMSDFLFELNNAIRKPKFEENVKDASTKKIGAKAFARRIVELEVEGMLRLGKVWFEMKKGNKKLDKYDEDFFLSHYERYKAGKVTKTEIIDAILKSLSGGTSITTEQFYMDQYPK